MVFSATSVQAYAKNGNAFSAIANQAVYALLGLVAFWICQRLPAGTLRYLGKYILGAAIVLLVILDLIGALRSVHVLGAKQGLGPVQADLLWLYLGPIGLQPAELAKLGMVLWGADVIARKGPALGHWRELARPMFPMVGLLFVLVGYNDLGTMLVLLALIVGLLWAAGVRLRVFGALGVLGLAGVGLLIAAASGGAGSGSAGGENYRLARLTNFLQPLDKCDAASNCYQLIQARSAIFEGGWFGVGLGKGALKWGWLPEGDNDFIFGVIAEELGVVGCAVVLALFSVLAYTGFRIARRSEDPFRRLAATAITTWLVSQAVINIGGVTGILPITGLPLPFISAGGSALVVTLAAIGMLASFARAEPDAARALNARPPARWVRLLWAPLPPVPPPRRPGKPRPPAQQKAGRAPSPAG
jgi:cell division protein FtsW